MLESFVYVKSIKEINSHVKVKFIVSLLLVINFCAVAYVASLQFWSYFFYYGRSVFGLVFSVALMQSFCFSFDRCFGEYLLKFYSRFSCCFSCSVGWFAVCCNFG